MSKKNGKKEKKQAPVPQTTVTEENVSAQKSEVDVVCEDEQWPPLTDHQQERRASIIAAINRKRKSADVGTASALFERYETRWRSTGILTLDWVMGGGLPRGRIIEIFGPNSGGKTTLALEMAKSIQRAGGVVYYSDVEHALDAAYVRSLSVNLDRMEWDRPENITDCLEAIDQAARSGAYDLIILDSLAALVSQREAQKGITDDNVGGVSAVMSQALKQLVSVLSKTGTTLIILNQIRYKIGVMFGDPENTPGGEAARFFSSIRLRVQPSGLLKEGDDRVGVTTRVECIKNKLAAPRKRGEFNILYGKGVDRINDLVEWLRTMGGQPCGVELKGAWWTIDGQTVAQGADKFMLLLQDRPDLFDGLMDRVATYFATSPAERDNIQHRRLLDS